MPRTKRLDWKNAVHHVMVRGVEKRNIFIDDSDRRRFVSRLGRYVEETGIDIYAWALLPNHAHILTRTSDIPLSKFMQKTLTAYAVYFNKRHDRTGHLFQNRYRSILVQEESYFLELVRYIHLNPLRSGIVNSRDGIDRYIWSGHAGIINKGMFAWQSTTSVLRHFKGNQENQLQNYLKYLFDNDIKTEVNYDEGNYLLGSSGLLSMESALEKGKTIGNHHRILGNRNFAKEVLDRIADNRGSAIRRRKEEHAIIEELIEYALEHWQIYRQALTGRGRMPSLSRVREFLVYAFVEAVGLSLVDSARILKISKQGAASAKERFKAKPKMIQTIRRITGQQVDETDYVP
ncbi:MAG: transposase [Candidatus Aegiribacteria sp.]|nr:transposase [Candidatus Aegiribacteria sp.]